MGPLAHSRVRRPVVHWRCQRFNHCVVTVLNYFWTIYVVYISSIFFIGAKEKQMPDLVSMINYESLTPIPALLCTVSYGNTNIVTLSNQSGRPINLLRVHWRRHVSAHVVLHVRQLDLVRGGRYGFDSMAFQVS